MVRVVLLLLDTHWASGVMVRVVLLSLDTHWPLV